MILVGILAYTLQPLHAQVAVGGCDKVTVTQVPSGYPNVLFVPAPSSTCPPIENECCKLVGLTPTPMLPLFTLQKLDASGAWVQASAPGTASVFNLDPIGDHGVYRVKIVTPYFKENECGAGSQPGGGGQPARIRIYHTNGQFLGWEGTYNNSPYPGNETYYTNRVIVGPTVPSDLALDWIEPPGSSIPSAYDVGQPVAIDVSDSKNYNFWWISLNQENSPNYASNGWTHGTIQEFEISDFWEENYPPFEPLTSYRLQWVIENYECRNGVHWPGSWNNLQQTLVICPAGTGCRLGMEQTALEVSIYPNPATSWIRVDNLDASRNGLYLMTLHDLSGKLLQSVPLTEQEIPVHDLPSGMLIARITLDGQLVHTEKVVIGH
jgi:hypothetical protein